LSLLFGNEFDYTCPCYTLMSIPTSRENSEYIHNHTRKDSAFASSFSVN